MVFRSIALALLFIGWAVAAEADPSAVENELKRNAQALLDALTAGDAKTWDRLLDPKVIQVDENNIVRDKAQILAEVKPLGPGLTGNLKVDDFRVALYDDLAVATY